MARTKRSRRSYGAGEWGRNRVRVFPDPKTGRYQIEWRANGRRLTRSLRHRDWAQAKRQADEFAAGFAGPELNGRAEAEPEPLTLDKLFDIYGEEVTPTKAETSQRSDRAATRMFLRFFGRGRRPETLSQRDWDRFIRARRSGRVGPSGRPVSDRTIEHDLKFLIAVLNWAAKSRDERGRLLLASNPLRGLRTPTERNPTRVVLSEEEYQTLLEVSRRTDWRFHVALVLAHETGHRIGAIRHLRWSDIDLEARVIRWRAEHEKTGYEHRTPMTAEAVAVLREARERSAGIEVPRCCLRRGMLRDARAGRWCATGGTELRSSRDSSRSAGEAGIRSGGSSPATSWTSRSRFSANLEAGRQPRRCFNAISEPTRDSFGRLWKLGGDLAAEVRELAGIK